MDMCVDGSASVERTFNTFVQFLKEFNEMWRKLLDGIIWEFQYQIEFVLDDKLNEPQQKKVCIKYAV